MHGAGSFGCTGEIWKLRGSHCVTLGGVATRFTDFERHA